MAKAHFIIIFIFLFIGCSQDGKYEKNIAKLDEVYGCDNPLRPLSARKYKECIAAQRGENESFFDINKSFQDAFNLNNNNSNNFIQNSVNQFLWSAALETTNNYSLKIADNQGGFIETEWIYDNKAPSDRCLIKIRIVSKDLVSDGVVTKIICENKIDNVWVSKNETLLEEEKRLTLAILNKAALLSSSKI